MKKSAFVTASAQAILFALAQPAFAQSGDEAAGGPSNARQIFDAITVTATKKADAENVQDVPIAVTAFNEDSLEALKVRDLTSLSYSAPNVQLEDVGTSRGVANFSIRGLGVNSSIPSTDPTVGVFVDGVYLGINNGLVLDLFDLESVEVLRGPQGLLFGRNTTGGAVLVNTGNPTSDFRAKARFTYEGPVDEGRGGPNRYAQATVSGPLIKDKLNGKISVYYNNDEGYFENQFDGGNLGEAETYVIRGALEAFPTDNLRLLAKFEYLDSETDGPVGQNRGTFERGTFDVAIDNVGLYDNETKLGTLRADWDTGFGDGTITNIFGYRDFFQLTDGDIDALPVFLFHSDSELDQEQISNELRYNGTFGRANVTVGLYYFNQEVAYTERRDLPFLGLPQFNGGGFQDHSVYGVFGQVEYEFTNRLTGIFGLRYSYEEKDARVTYVRPRPQCSVVSGTCPVDGTNPFIPGEPNGFSDSDDWSNITPKVGLQYYLNDDTQFYASYTRGFRSGGYNFRITNPVAFLDQVATTGAFSFDEEKVNAFEVGSKWQFLDGRGVLNSALFYTDISDLQREVNFASATSGVSQSILNTADARIFGLELEGRFAVTDNLILTGNLGLIDAEYQDVLFDISGDGVIDNNDENLALPRVPEATYGVGLIHELPLGRAGSLSTRFNFQHRDEFAYTDNNLGFISSSDIVDANLTWNTPVEGIAISVYGKNLLDESLAGNDTQVPFGGPRSTGVAEPFASNPTAGTFSPLIRGRRLGVELTLSY